MGGVLVGLLGGVYCVLHHVWLFQSSTFGWATTFIQFHSLLYTHHDKRVFEHDVISRVVHVETEVVSQPLIPIIEGLSHKGVEDRSGADRKHRVYNDERWSGGSRGRVVGFTAGHEQVPKEDQ